MPNTFIFSLGFLEYLDDETLVHLGRTCRFFRDLTYQKRLEADSRHIPLHYFIPENARIKVGLFGDKKVGKTAFIERFIKGSFSEKPVFGLENYAKNLQGPDGKVFVLQIHDSSNTPIENAIYSRGYDIVIILVDLQDPKILDTMILWEREVQRYKAKEAPLIFIGTKSDLGPHPFYNETDFIGLAKGFQAMWFTSSAKTGDSINKAFIASINEYASVQGLPAVPTATASGEEEEEIHSPTKRHCILQ